MQKLIAWCSLFLLAFIPLYPKLPIVDVKNTWVYVRLEDFIILFVILGWVALFFQKKVTLKTPLTLPILLFWLVGVVATIHSVLLIAPTVFEIHPNVSFLSFIRRIEYMSLFFVAYSAVRDKRFVSYVVLTVAATVLTVSLYGIGQKYAGLPAFLTMNEEFAKGIPIQLSPLSRVSSTFGGHYDLAAYLVLTIPIIASAMFGARRWATKGALGLITGLGFFVLLTTVSRISVFALAVSFGLVLFFQKRTLALFLVPVALVGSLALLMVSPQLLDRFGSTVREVDVLVDANTGQPVGHIKEVPNTYFENKVVRQLFYDSIGDVASRASPSARFIIPYANLPETVALLTESTAPTGEDLPSGTGYINLTLSPNERKIGEFFYEPTENAATTSAEVFIINGSYIVKQARAYDLSFTTRFQGEWPKALLAFKRNILWGSGYGSVSLAVDNSYLRMLAEVGSLGFMAFFSIFFIIGMKLRYTLPKIDSPLVKSFVVGFMAGVTGLFVNGLFIDVFEASKVAFTLWLLIGMLMGTLSFYSRRDVRFSEEVRKVLTGTPAVIAYLFLITLVLYVPMTRNFFVGDDFTWFRWAEKSPSVSSIVRFFTDSAGFFYRPGAKLYFSLMYQLFWLSQTAYHTVSLFLHFIVTTLVFFLARKLMQSRIKAFLGALLFLVLTGFSEAVFWISASGFLFTSAFTLLSLLLYIMWRETKKTRYMAGAMVSFIFSLLFHELGIVTPFLYVVYEWTLTERPTFPPWAVFSPLPLYAALRYFSNTHWLSGDYNYNLLKLPLNAIGNTFGYSLYFLLGPSAASAYQPARALLREHVVIALLLFIVGGLISYQILRRVRIGRLVRFAMLFSLISLTPFLGFGNIAPRYGYLASVGMALLLVVGIEKLYTYLLANGASIARAAIVLVIGTFGLFHIVVLQKLHGDWYEAGQNVQRFLISIDSAYLNSWKTSPIELHFVNVPIRHKDAWVFPVGLSDALWFIFRNPDIKVYAWSSIERAFDAVTYGSETQKVFVFDESGNVKQVTKPLPVVQ